MPDAPVLHAAAALEFCTAVLVRAGYRREDADLCADSLVESSLRGIDSHGVTTLLPTFARSALEGSVDTGASPEVVSRRGAAAVVDGRRAPALATGQLAARTGAGLAREHGVGAVVAREVGYLGALWWLVEPQARDGLIALAACNSLACVAPHGGREALHGTNPIAVAVPQEPDPIVFDTRTNALRMADYWRSVSTGAVLPDGTLILPDGTPTAEAGDVDCAVYLPLAGARGYGLALVVDVLAPALAGGPIGREVDSDNAASAFFLVLDPGAFDAGFTDSVCRLADQAHMTAPLEGTAVRLPGERGFAERRLRLESGIPVDPIIWRRMDEALAELGLAVPSPLAAR